MLQRKKIIVSIALILLCIVLSIHPHRAEMTEEPEMLSVDCIIVDEEGVLSQPLMLSQEEITAFFGRISSLSEDIGSEDSYLEFLRTVTTFFENADGDSLLEQGIFEMIGDVHLNLIGKRVFILSYGHGFQINPLRKLQVNLLRPSFLFWYYPGTHQGFLKDRTIIVDPSPFDITVFDGRQIGLLRRFIGVYIFIPGATSMMSTMFFVGYAYRVMGLDLSPAN